MSRKPTAGRRRKRGARGAEGSGGQAGNGAEEGKADTEGLSRRRFLQVSGLLSGAAGLEMVACAPGEEGVVELDDGLVVPVNLKIEVVRPRDFVVLKFEFIKVGLNSAKSALVPSGTGSRYIIVTHASQHVFERAFLEKPQFPQTISKPVPALLSGPSRVVFKVPASFTSVPYDLPSLLDLIGTLEMNVSKNATPRKVSRSTTTGLVSGQTFSTFDNTFTSTSSALVQRSRLSIGDDQLASSLSVPTAELRTVSEVSNTVIVAQTSPGRPVEPTATQTALEVPFRLLMSPNAGGGWAHSPVPVERNGRVELWHTRLGVRTLDGDVDEKSTQLRTLRALWTRDSGLDPDTLSTSTPADAFPGPLTGPTRIQIVHNTSNFAPAGLTGFTPDPVDVARLMLTGMGAWFDVHGEWKTPAINLQSWDNRTTHGRDHYVKVVLAGYLFPWRHRASLVVVTERKFTTDSFGAGDEHVAFLWKRIFVIVREPLVSYSPGAALRGAPFLKIGVKQLVTPDLTASDDDIDAAIAGTAPLLLRVSPTDPYRFPLEGADRTGRLSRWNGAAVWVPSKTGAGSPPPANVEGFIRTAARGMYASVARAQLSGQRVAFAKPDRVDDTTYETDSIDFKDIDDGSGNSAPGFFAGLAEAALRVEAVRQLTGNAAPSSFQYADQYLANEFAAPGNKGHLLFKVKGGATVPVSFKKKSDQTGGFIAPSMDVSGLSRKAGPIAGPLDKVATNTVSPSEIFSSIDALLFGVFKLGDILSALGLDEAPKFVTQGLDVVEDFFGMIEKLSKVAQDFSNAADDVIALPGTLVTAIAEAKTAITNILAAAVALDVTEILVHVGTLDGALADVQAGVDAIDPKVASGLREQVRKLVGQVRDVIASDLEPPLMAFSSAQELAKNQIVRLEWRPPIKPFLGIFDPQNPRGLLLSVEARAKDLPGKPAGVDLLASLEDFNLNLIGDARFMVLKFQRLQFRVASNKKPEIDVVFDDLVFDGVLSFVQKLRELIPLEGFSDPPNVEVTPEGIKAGFTLPIPGVAVGMFSLDNLSLGAGFKIPFIGPPLSVSFSFCTREEPFILTVSMIGGGGFFGITLNPQGIELLEAALEAGACLAVDFGVASGSISIMLGIYFRMEGDDASLTGYLRFRGEVDVLGIISASIELRMELTYEFSSHKCVGRASIEIEVSVFCLSFSVTVEAERKFSGSNDDPTFAELMAPIGTYKPWDEYVRAFAA